MWLICFHVREGLVSPDHFHLNFHLSFTWPPAVQIIPAPVQQATPTTIKVQKHNKVPRAPRISGEERSSPGNRTGNRQSQTLNVKNFLDFTVCN